MFKIISLVTAISVATCFIPLELQAQQAGGVQYLTPDTLTFQPFPEELGAKIATLYGNPAQPGHYIVRFRFARNWSGRLHTHGGAELLTVHSGTCYVAYGDQLTREAAQQLPAGSFLALPPETKMRAFTGDEGCVVDVQGQGPFTTQYLDRQGSGGS